MQKHWLGWNHTEGTKKKYRRPQIIYISHYWVVAASENLKRLPESWHAIKFHFKVVKVITSKTPPFKFAEMWVKQAVLVISFYSQTNCQVSLCPSPCPPPSLSRPPSLFKFSIFSFFSNTLWLLPTSPLSVCLSLSPSARLQFIPPLVSSLLLCGRGGSLSRMAVREWAANQKPQRRHKTSGKQQKSYLKASQWHWQLSGDPHTLVHTQMDTFTYIYEQVFRGRMSCRMLHVNSHMWQWHSCVWYQHTHVAHFPRGLLFTAATTDMSLFCADRRRLHEKICLASWLKVINLLNHSPATNKHLWHHPKADQSENGRTGGLANTRRNIQTEREICVLFLSLISLQYNLYLNHYLWIENPNILRLWSCWGDSFLCLCETGEIKNPSTAMILIWTINQFSFQLIEWMNKGPAKSLAACEHGADKFNARACGLLNIAKYWKWNLLSRAHNGHKVLRSADDASPVDVFNNRSASRLSIQIKGCGKVE